MAIRMASRKFHLHQWLRLIVLCCCALVSLSPIADHQARAQSGAGSLFNGINDFIGYLKLAQPNSTYSERTINTQQALNDHTNDEIFDSSSQEIIERSGFSQVTHYVTSEDGYITELINVINPRADRSKLKQPPVMIFHGGLVDTNVWLWASAIQHQPEKYPRAAGDGPITSSNRSLGFMLTNYGYDVWLVATRGSNSQNMGHTTLKAKLLEDIMVHPFDPDAPRMKSDTLKYFEYSQDELVDFEFPAQINRVLNLTGSSKVSTITYSFSSQIMFKLLASNKELAPKIYTNCALATILDRNGMSLVVNKILNYAILVPPKVGNHLQQLKLSRLTRKIMRAFNRYTTAYILVSLLVGPSPRFQTFLEDPVIGHVLQPTSIVEYKQFGQQTLVGRLQKLDHGRENNLQLYGQATPPVYNITNINIKRWMLISGDTDTLGTQSSADKYVQLIPNEPYKHIRRVGGWNHLDSVAAFNNDVIINLPVLEFFDHFSSLNRSQIEQATN